ncbi:MAG: T9SS type A sorting domain-containing protein [Flavipsychrobacter sp.]
MKTFYHLFAVCFFLCLNHLQAQSFYNGSIEPVTGSSVVSCQDNIYWNINTIGNVFMTTVGPQKMFMADNTCGIGAAKDGTHYIGLHYSPTMLHGNQLLLELNANMIGGQSYVFSFYYKGPSPLIGTGANLNYGFAINDTTVDTTAVVFIVAPVDTIWRKVTATITPAINCRFIWVAAEAPASGSGDSATTYVDDFVFNPISNVPDVSKTTAIHLYPDPVTTTATLELDDNVALPCAMQVYDIAGRKIMQQDNINTKKVNINRCSLEKGVYFLQLTDKKSARYTTRFVAE